MDESNTGTIIEQYEELRFCAGCSRMQNHKTYVIMREFGKYQIKSTEAVCEECKGKTITQDNERGSYEYRG